MKYLILGAGPSGLTFANRLKQIGETDFLILEKENEAGGLCRSVDVDGFPFDIGGGHFLDVRRRNVNEFLFSFMPKEEWDLYDRNSQIFIKDSTIHYPIESNIWQMKVDDQISYLKSIALSGSNLGQAMPEKFTDWIYWKLGSKIANDYMIPYNQKIFGINLDLLGTYWLEKLPDVSFEETLRSCLVRKAYGIQPAHTQFYYPKKYGYGEVWLRMADIIKDNIEYGKSVKKIDFCTRTVTTADKEKYVADNIITTIPWNEFEEMIGIPETLFHSVKRLKYSSIQTKYFPENLDTSAQWIYCPDSDLAFHRILVRCNFCPGSNGYWTETNSERLDTRLSDDHFAYMNRYAYPLNTVDKPKIMEKIISWGQTHRVFGLGRWGEYQHYNSDVVVDRALSLVKRIRSIP